MGDLEYVVAHLPEDLDARFAGVDTKLAAIREALALHTTRFTAIEHKIAGIEAKLDSRFDAVFAQLAELRQLIGSR